MRSDFLSFLQFWNLRRALALDNESNNESVQTQSLRENKNQNHSNEKLRLLGSGAHSRVSNNSNGHTSSKTAKTDAEASTEVSEALEARVSLSNCGGSVAVRQPRLGRGGGTLQRRAGRQGLTRRANNHSNDQTVDTNHTSHNHGNHGAHDEVGVKHTHGSDTNTALGSTVSGTHAGEHESARDTHEAEEGGGKGAVIGLKHHHHGGEYGGDHCVCVGLSQKSVEAFPCWIVVRCSLC